MVVNEGAPFLPPPDLEKSEPKKTEKKEKKKKRAGDVGRQALESGSKNESDREVEEAKPEKPAGPFARLKKIEAEAEPVNNPEALEGKLDKDEKPLAASLLAEQRLQDLPEAPTEAEDVAAREFLERVQGEQDIETAATATLAELGATAEEISEVADEAGPAEAPAVIESQPEEADEEIVFDRSAEAVPEAEPENDEDDASTYTSARPAGTPPPASPPPPRGPGGGGPGNMPPNGEGPLPPFGMPFEREIPAIPVVEVPNTAPAAEHYYDQGNPAAAALLGGIIGYFIGRRRGRIRTEKKLLPVQKKLEKQVNDLHWELKAAESKVRRVAAGKVRVYGNPAVIEKLAPPAAEKSQPRPEIITPVERKRAPEAHQLHGEKAPERIGQVLIAAAESRPAVAHQERAKPVVEKLPEKPEQAALRQTEKRVETLSRSELLSLSEKIVVDGSTLRQIYETHLVGEKGLRRLVGEYMRGGDIKKALRQEIVEHEIDFERDPIMRDMRPQQSMPQAGGRADSTALDALLQKVSLGQDTSQEVAHFKAQAKYEALQQEQQHKQQHWVDVTLFGTIALLIGLVVFFFLTRG